MKTGVGMKKLEDLEEISDMGFDLLPISSVDHDQSTTVDSSCSVNSFAYYRTNSETSAFSELLTDDSNSCSSETQPPVCWPATGSSPFLPALSRFGGIRCNHKLEKDDKLDDHKPTDLEKQTIQIIQKKNPPSRFLLEIVDKTTTNYRFYVIQDTVKTFNPFADEGRGEGTGWAFKPLTRECMLDALRVAIETYRKHKPSWRGLIKRGMERNSSWDNATVQYEEVFKWAFIDPPYVS
ncbi:hypothetical protein L6452_05470 [Arctium lappa]|uniref:Uncharacterized protein n=1 Tax=Arctium lappa TaxID=4217 RepID=A0ACB9EGT0_ARCLA|nr:hypothetical protein L6452_05470 [Arctium lappa]